jgi:hypothetical protein
MQGPLTNIPVVAVRAYRERVQRLDDHFTATLAAEPDNRYNPRAVAVLAPGGAKIGYLPPEIARHRYDDVRAASDRGRSLTCPARRGGPSADGPETVRVDLGTVPASSGAGLPAG